eukprot:755518-Hanusia_phi.AAC.1
MQSASSQQCRSPRSHVTALAATLVTTCLARARRYGISVTRRLFWRRAVSCGDHELGSVPSFNHT